MDITKIIESLPVVIGNQIQSVIDTFHINTPERLATFLGQCAHESAGFKVFTENLNYSSEGLLAVFPHYFNKDNAPLYQRNPEKIANRVYAGRMGNGDEMSGDGWKYKGRGAIQLTGKNNYEAFGNSIGVDTLVNPEWVTDKYALLSAAWFFSKNHLNEIADKGISDAVITEITKHINGGTKGLSERIELTNKYYAVLKSVLA